MDIPLYYSVLLFIFPAIYGRSIWVGPALTALLPIAVINHAKFDTVYSGKRTIMAIDRVGSHMLAAKLLLDVVNCNLIVLIPFIIFIASTVYAAVSFHVLKRRTSSHSNAKLVHASMHAVSSIGIMSAIYILRVQRSQLISS